MTDLSPHSTRPLPPKPTPRPQARVSLWRYLKLFRRDILSAQPARLYHAWMAEFRTPFFRSYMVNDPQILREVLRARPLDFPKSARVSAGLKPLLGPSSVFLTNGEEWLRQRRIIDPAFAGGRLSDTFPAMWDAGTAMMARLGQGGAIEAEEMASHAAADVIFRTLFSVPIENEIAAQVFTKFRAYQRAQPILNLAALVGLRGMPGPLRRNTRRAAREIRGLIAHLVAERAAMIEAGIAPGDLATKIMTAQDPETGNKLSQAEMVDQVAIFFLAGHETSAAALGWSLYLLATHPEWQDILADEAAELGPDPRSVKKQAAARDVFREAMRLYPPVPMMVRHSTKPEHWLERDIPKGAQVVVSPWHLQRHERLWDNPDAFDPARWQTDAGKESARCAYMPFSDGARACPGAGFAMVEGPLFLALIARTFRVLPEGATPKPIAHLTVRSENGIGLRLVPR